MLYSNIILHVNIYKRSEGPKH